MTPQATRWPDPDALLADIDGWRPSPGRMALWWLGQHSFVIRAGATILYVDPFLTPMAERRVPPLLRPGRIRHADAICGTHDHADHIDRPVWPALAEASPQARFVVPELLREGLVRDLGIGAERFTGLDDGDRVEIGDVRITALPAAHELLDRDEATGLHPCLGYVIQTERCAVYHAGDTCLYEGLHERLRRWPRFAAMLLPINGRDGRRYRQGILGNMTYQEAVDLAGALEPELVMPTHHDMFAFNPGDAGAFAEYAAAKYPRLRVHLGGYGERLVVPPA